MTDTFPAHLGPADAPSRALPGETVGILGYGNLGRTVALNLRDSGVTVLVGNREDEAAEQARGDGFAVVSLAEAAAADIAYVLLPDEVIPEVFAETIGAALRPGSAVAFASGYPLAFDALDIPATVDTLMVAPRMAGETARRRFVDGDGFWAYVSVERDATGRGRQRMIGLAAAMGILRAGALELDARTEARLDLYIEQTVGPLLGLAIMLAFEVGVESGIPAPALVLEMYMSGEFETVFQSFREQGFYEASAVHGPTALFGGMIRTLDADRAGMVEQFRRVLGEIDRGEFARRFAAERDAGYPMLQMAAAMGGGAMSDAEGWIRKTTGG